MALVRPPQWSVDQLFRGHSLTIVLDGLQDPGNAGTILRAAEAFGATGVAFLKGTVSPYNPKCLRASAGSIFRVPVVAGARSAAFSGGGWNNAKIELVCADAQSAADVGEVRLQPESAPSSSAAKGEASANVCAIRATPIRIPTVGVESLERRSGRGHRAVCRA